MDGRRLEGSPKSHWKSLDDGVGATQTHPTGKLLQQAGDGTGRAGRRGLEANSGAVGCQEELPHRLQTGLTLRGERTP